MLPSVSTKTTSNTRPCCPSFQRECNTAPGHFGFGLHGTQQSGVDSLIAVLGCNHDVDYARFFGHPRKVKTTDRLPFFLHNQESGICIVGVILAGAVGKCSNWGKIYRNLTRFPPPSAKVAPRPRFTSQFQRSPGVTTALQHIKTISRSEPEKLAETITSARKPISRGLTRGTNLPLQTGRFADAVAKLQLAA